MKNSLVAVALIVVPLVIAAAISYWPPGDAGPPISSVIVLPAKIKASPDLAYLSDAIAAALTKHLAGIPGIEVKVPPSSPEVELLKGDYSRLAGPSTAGAVVLSALTVDAGIYQLDLQILEPQTRRVIWSNSYQSSGVLYNEMIRAAGDGLRRALQAPD